MDPLVKTTLCVAAVAGAASLTALFNKKTSKVTKTVAVGTAISAGLGVSGAFAAENSVGGEGLVFLFILPALMASSALGATWNAAALYEGRATRKRMENEQEAAAPSDHTPS